MVLVLVPKTKIVDAVAKKHGLEGSSYSVFLADHVFGKERDSFSEKEAQVGLKKIERLVRHYGHPSWAAIGVAELAAMHGVLLRKVEKAYGRAAGIFSGLASMHGHQVAEGHGFEVLETSGFDAPFLLAVTRRKDASPQRLVYLPFDVELIDGEPHAVFFTFQGRRGKKEAISEMSAGFPDKPPFKGKDWRAKVVLLVEKLCNERGVPFAMLNPERNREIMDPQIKRGKSQEEARQSILKNMRITYESAGLKLMPGNSRYYVRPKPRPHKPKPAGL